MADNSFQVIKPPNSLRAKVGVGGPNAVSAETLARAEKVITDLTDNYLEWVEDDLKKIRVAYDRLVNNEGPQREALDAMFRIAHDIKGQGGSFGYDLVTVIGNQLCHFLENREAITPAGIEAVGLHIEAIKVVIGQRMTGDGGKAGEMLLSGLTKVLEKTSGS